MSPERPDPIDTRIEEATSAFRERDADGRILPSASWCDLTAEQRDELFRRQLVSRVIEREMNPGRLSATARAVLDRALLLRQGD